MAKIKLFINGFGRIGRCVARLALNKFADDFELVGINDPANAANLAYLFAHDTIHNAHSPIKVEILGENLFSFNNTQISFSAGLNPAEIDIKGASVVIESSGRFLDSISTKKYLENGAKRVILSAPANDDTPTFVLGVNSSEYKGQKIISNASCTTNALAPIIKVLDENFGVESGILTTIHSYTNDQNLIDGAHRKGDLRRSRAAAANIIPTTTGAAKALHLVLPKMKGRLHGHSVRVPVADVSMVDLVVNLNKEADKEAINAAFTRAANTELKGILGVDSYFGVSSDFLGCPLSSIVASDLTFILNLKMAKIMSWYDNEWGYSNRLLEMAKFISK